MNCESDIGTWDVESHHVAFPPGPYLATLPSGKCYSKFIISVQCNERASFYLVNTVPFIISLPILAAMAFLIEPEKVTDRLGVVLALLIAIAAYKTSIGSWMPQKGYTTYLDRYVLLGFGAIELVG